MIPAWVVTSLVLILGCILALVVGSTLPDYDYLGVYVFAMVLLCTVTAAINRFPILLAIGMWIPFALPVPVFRNFPPFALVLGWTLIMLLFRLCLAGSLRYIKSYNLFLLIVFAWVPIRFLMNPVQKLGAGVSGGNGVSGAFPYFLFMLAGLVTIISGAVLNTRENIMSFMRWSFYSVMVVGLGLLYCAFSPWTAPFLISMGSFSAGSMGDGIQRLVQLPGYGIYLMEAATAPALFHLQKKTAVFVFLLGTAMVIIGGNRSSLAAAFIALPIILFLRRKTALLIVAGAAGIFGLFGLHLYVVNTDVSDIPPLVRSFGIFESKIDEATGGSASANWRYDVWQSGIDKIKEDPLIGKGFGNLPKRFDPNMNSGGGKPDFESLLAGGEAHNGFINSAYAFGIPFTLFLTVFIFLGFFKECREALATDTHDKELRDLHAFLAGLIAAFPLIIYSSLDLSQSSLWLYISFTVILAQLKARSALEKPNTPSASSGSADAHPYRYQAYYSKR